MVSFSGTVEGTKWEKLEHESGLKISSSELCDNFMKSEVEPLLLVLLMVDKNGGEMDDDAEKGS